MARGVSIVVPAKKGMVVGEKVPAAV